MTLLNVLLQAPAQGGAAWQSIVMMVLLFAVFYFFLIRPQSKKQKEIRKQREAMKAGDKVVTAGGIYGRIKEISDATVLIEVADNVRIKVDKNSVYVAAEDAQQAVTK